MADIAYQNKDIASKIYTENLKGKSFEAYGLSLPKVEDVVSVNLPAIIANERRVDGLAYLADKSFALVDYESEYAEKDKLDYLTYGSRILKIIWKPGLEKPPRLRIIIIYTGDVKRKNTQTMLDTGSILLKTETAYLSELNGNEILNRIEGKLNRKEPLTDTELMELGIFPLSFPGTEEKLAMIRKAVELAKLIPDRKKQAFTLSHLMVFTDKVMPEDNKKDIKGWIMMTTFGKLFEEEKQEAVREAVQEAVRETTDKVHKEDKEEHSRLILSEGLSLGLPKEALQAICDKVMLG